MIGIVEVAVGDEPDSWTEAGFSVVDGRVGLGPTVIRLRGDGGPTTWTLWRDDGSGPADLDGIPTSWTDEPGPVESPVHPIGGAEIDHVVVASPDLDRTTGVLEALGAPCRRTRDTGTDERPMQQRFFRFGPAIIEMVGSPTRRGEGPAALFGLALTVTDLDAAAGWLGERCGRVKDAVQPGRRITTIRTRDLGVSLPLALMSA